MSRLSRTSLMLAMFLLVDKGVAIIRQVIISRQFKFSKELDVFNVANNVPDLLFALISGGALAMAFLPVLSEVLNKSGRPAAWGLFSRIANLAFLGTGVLAIVVALLADPIVRSEIGVAPGFSEAQKTLVVELMRLNLIATLIFSISGLVMSSLQANQHFVMPALAPILYNLGQIFGAVILAPTEGYKIGSFQLPALGLGVHGLVYGVILGAILHLGIQIPALARFQFHWTPRLDLGDPLVHKVLKIMAPRLATMLAIQLTFVARDNLASRLSEGSVSALTYGWMIMQVPETVIGTAIGIAILPTLAELAAREELEAFRAMIDRALRTLLALTLPVAVALALNLRPLLALAFGLDETATSLLFVVSQVFLIGLAGQCVNEVAVRSFYARQDPLIPMAASMINLAIYAVLGFALYQPLGAPGLALTDALAFSSQAVLLLVWQSHRVQARFHVLPSIGRGLMAAVAAGAVSLLLGPALAHTLPGVIAALATMGAAVLAAVPFILTEVRGMVRL